MAQTTIPPPFPQSSLPPPPAPPTPVGHRSNGRRSARAILRSALVLAAIAGSYLIDGEILLTVVFVFAVVVPFEKLFPRHAGQKIRRPELRTDMAFAMLGPILNIAAVGVAIVVGILSLAWLPGLAFRPVVSALPPAIVPFVAFALFDVLGYWAHRLGHEVPALWSFHKVHHSTKILDWVSGFRSHPLDGAFIAPPFFFLLAAGFEVEQVGAIAVVQIVFGLFLHANVRWQFRPIRHLVATPEFHHWHHANEPEAIHSNYSALFPIWDIVFGTFFMPEGRHPSRYGVDEEMPTDTIGLLREPLQKISFLVGGCQRIG